MKYVNLFFEFLKEKKLEKSNAVVIDGIVFDENCDSSATIYCKNKEEFFKEHCKEISGYNYDENYDRFIRDLNDLAEYLLDDFEEWIDEKGYAEGEQQIIWKEFHDNFDLSVECYFKTPKLKEEE